MTIARNDIRTSHAGRIAGWAATTLVVAGTAASGADATVISFAGQSEQVAPILISLAGSASPLYSLTYTNDRTSTTTYQSGRSCDKYGYCTTTNSSRTETVQYKAGNINSLSPNALIGTSSLTPGSAASDTTFSTNSQTMYWWRLRTVSPVEYTGIPFSPIPTSDSPLANKFLPLKFTVGNTDYLGDAKFTATGGLDYIVYDAVPGAVPEPDSWAMMIAGLGLTGAALRRRRSAARRASERGHSAAL